MFVSTFALYLTHNSDSEPVEIVMPTAGESGDTGDSTQYGHGNVVEELLEGKVSSNTHRKVLKNCA